MVLCKIIMIINTILDTEDFVHLYYPEDEVPNASQGCGAGARMASKFTNRPPTPEYSQVTAPRAYEMCERVRAAPPPESPPRRVRAADMYPRLRVHYDEPDLDVPYVPICGEFVQFVGRTADGGVLAMSNYRLHAQARRRRGAGVSVPLRLVDAAEVRDLLQLLVYCKDGRTLKCTFNSGEQCAEWWRRVSSATAACTSLEETFAAAYAAWARELPPASAPRALLEPQKGNHNHWFKKEVERLGFTTKGAWRVTAANSEYKLCPSYPPLLIVPASIGDEDLDSVARFRAMRRVPAVVWRHRGNGAVIARSSQPEVGWLGWRSSEDERLLAAFVSACALDRALQPASSNKQAKLLIVDARSYTSAVTNRARGGGCECAQYYPLADIQFMCLPNIHHVRRSFHQLRQLAAEPPDQPNWHSTLERTLWLQYVSGVGRAASLAARAVLAGRPVLVHCSDGWDRTPQIVAAAQLLLDPYYRTVEGFRVLVEREWLDFGHKFADRCGHTFGPEEPNERSPIFLQWLDLVHQLMLQYPSSFEFSQAYLIKLVTHAHSCMFGTFLCNSPRERSEARVQESTANVWKLLDGPAYRNHLYSPPRGEQVLWAEYNVRSLSFWWALYVGGGKDAEAEEGDVEVAPSTQPLPLPASPPNAPLTTTPQAINGTVSKSRSCENLASEADKPRTQRRCSDPSLAPDLLKMASLSIPSSESGSSPGTRAERALTDSYFDGLGPDRLDRPDGPPVNGTVRQDELSDQTDVSTSSDAPASTPRISIIDQVDGLHLNHFENGHVQEVLLPSGSAHRDITSNSSSLERELAPSVSVDSTRGTASTGAGGTERTERMVRSDSALVVGEGAGRGLPRASSGLIGSSLEESSVFLDDNYANVINVPEVPPAEHSRVRHISITWRSVSESSHHTDSSAGFDPLLPTERFRPAGNTNGNSNGDVGRGSKMDEQAVKLLEVELGNLTTGTSSSLSSESEEERSGAGGAYETAARTVRCRLTRTRKAQVSACGSQQTLCPNSPSIRLGDSCTTCTACCCCCHRASNGSVESVGVEGGSEPRCCGPGVERRSSGEWGSSNGARGRCVCGAGGGALARDPIDGLPASHSPVQARLHQIILHQNMLVEELSDQLRAARAELRRRLTSPPPPSPAQHAAPARTAAHTQPQWEGEVGEAGEVEEVEVGEEAAVLVGASGTRTRSAGVVWVPDSAAPRCQYCRNHFWLARRRHHCRKCGGIFCGSCSEVGKEGAAQRVCRVCRSRR